MNINPKAQSWSIDIALGVAVFIAAFFIFYFLLSPSQASKAGSLKSDASSVIRQVASEEAAEGVVDGEEINVSKLNELKNLSYDELRRRLRVEGDFCIYFEDEQGNIVIINDSYKGIGSPNINISGTPCSQK